jgi:CRISPR/Cas system CSM-associated protein Csm3 (group 7 of RAMP superfamily)
MTTRLTLFTATLVQDSALSVSGLDRESIADQPFTLVDGVPTLVGRGLKGAAVAMARRFFHPLPRVVSEDAAQRSALRRSAWEFADATPLAAGTAPRIRAGVGIRHKTGARAKGVLYDREVIPAGTKWVLMLRVDWSHAANEDEGTEAEGILGYVLAHHWAHGRCWLGGGAARGLGWCHLEDLRAWRFDAEAYEGWVRLGRPQQPEGKPIAVPIVEPTRSWCFRTLDVDLTFGEYRPEPGEPAWGLDMLAIGPHDTERAMQPTGDGSWAKPSWATNAQTPDALSTDRAILMEGARPLLPGASVRGPLRHAFSRAERALGKAVQDPHGVKGAVGPDDPGGQTFGTVAKSSRILIRDGSANGEWSAAKLHMHAEDEFSAGSYGSAKRDAIRVLRGTFPTRIVVEGPTRQEVEPLVQAIDGLVALGALGHLPVGGHKTRGAGWGRWEAKPWIVDDVSEARSWAPPPEAAPSSARRARNAASFESPSRDRDSAKVRVTHGSLSQSVLILVEAAREAQKKLGRSDLVAWWCDPTIDLALAEPPATFGREWPLDDKVQVDEVAFYAERAVWRAARTVTGSRWVFIEEVDIEASGVQHADVVHTPARLHGFTRFSAADTGRGTVLLREWHVGDQLLGFTIAKENR